MELSITALGGVKHTYYWPQGKNGLN